MLLNGRVRRTPWWLGSWSFGPIYLISVILISLHRYIAINYINLNQASVREYAAHHDGWGGGREAGSWGPTPATGDNDHDHDHVEDNDAEDDDDHHDVLWNHASQLEILSTGRKGWPSDQSRGGGVGEVNFDFKNFKNFKTLKLWVGDVSFEIFESLKNTWALISVWRYSAFLLVFPEFCCCSSW